MKNLTTILLLLPAALGAQRTLKQDVERLLGEMVSTFKSDPASVAKYYTDDATIIGGGQRAEGRQQIDAYWHAATVFVDWQLEVIEVGGDGESPWVRGRSTLHGRSGRVMVTEFVGLLKRRPEGLRFHVDMFAAPSPGPARRTPTLLRSASIQRPLRAVESQ